VIATKENAGLSSKDMKQIIDSRFEHIYKQGKIPTSKNLPFTEVLNPDKTLKSADDIFYAFKKLNIEKPD
jgi:3-mercaptopyruvate sulfurtransferase SseA